MNSPSTYTKLFFVSLLTSSLFAQGPDFSASIYANGGGDSEYVMTFGFSPDATDGYDAGIDYYAPPAPPTGFDAALGWNNDRYYTQILQGLSAGEERVFDIQLQYGSDNSITLNWDNTNWC